MTPSAQQSNRSRNRNSRNRSGAKTTITQKSVGAIIMNAKNEVLIMFSSQNKYWEFPKGKMEHGEKELDTLKREVYEETGIQRFRLNPGFRDYLRYTFRVGSKLIRKTVVYYMFKTGAQVQVSDEHLKFKWVPLSAVRKDLKHPNQRKLVDKIEEYLEEHPI